MKTVSGWSYEHFRIATQRGDGIYINRVVPESGSIRLYHNGGEGSVVFFRRRPDDAGTAGGQEALTVAPTTASEKLSGWESLSCDADKAVIPGLENGADYEFFIRAGERQSPIGVARPGVVAGTVVNYLSMYDEKYKFSGRCLCTPCLLVRPDGYLLASMDIYEKGAPQNLTLLFGSDDGGESWHHICELFPCYWGTLFWHRGALYMLATSTEYGDLLLGKSTDGGRNWHTPTVLLRGACNRSGPGWHKSSGRVTEHAGRLWCAIDYGSHVLGTHASSLISVDVNADLLDPASWELTDPLDYNPDWPGASMGDNRGFIEGNAVVGPDGRMYNFLRYNIDRGRPSSGLAGMLRADEKDSGAALKFHKFVGFPGNHSKFDLIYDGQSGRYYSIVSRIYDPTLPKARNLLSLLSSKDLENWEIVCDLIDRRDADPAQVGYQYVSMLIDGEDIIYLSRTADNGARNFHDSNYITFHRIRNFRKL